MSELTFLQAMAPSYHHQKILGFISFAISNNRLKSTKLSKYCQFVPIIVYTVLWIITITSNGAAVEKVIRFDSFINIQFTLAFIIAILTVYTISLTSIVINEDQILYYNKIIDIDRKLKENLDITIDYRKKHKYVRRLLILIVIFLSINAFPIYFYLFGIDGLFIFIIISLIPDAVVFSDNLIYFITVKLINDRILMLEQHFTDYITKDNVVQRFEAAREIYFELCELIQHQSVSFGLRMFFNLIRDTINLILLMFSGYWIYSDTFSVLKIIPPLVHSIPTWCKIFSVAWVCHFTAKLVIIF